MELLKHELYKIFSKKFVLIGFTVFIPLYLIYVLEIAPSSLASYKEAGRFYRSYEGQVTESKASEIKEGMKETEVLYKNGVKLDSKHLGIKLLYTDMMNEMSDKSKVDNIKAALEKQLANTEKTSFEYKKEKLQLSLVNKIKTLSGIYYTEGWKSVIKFWQDIGYWFVLIFCLLGISDIISQEYSEGMEKLIPSTKEGKKKIITAKIGAACIFVFTVTITISIVDIITNAYIYGLFRCNIGIRYIYELFSQSPYNIKIWQFYLLQQLFLILGSLIICFVFILISIFIKNSGVSFMGMLIIFMISDIISRGQTGSLANGLMPSELLRLSNLGKNYANIYNFIGQPLTYETVLLIADASILLILVAAIIKCFRKYGLREC